MKVGAASTWASFFRNPLRLPKDLKRLLVVDDKEPFPQFVSRCVAPGVKVHKATSGEEALALARAALPGLILVDWVMPGMSGEEVVRRLRQDAATKTIPTILISAYIDPGDPREAQRARTAGANLFMTKEKAQAMFLAHREEALIPHPGNRPVLVIEDDPGCQDFIRHVLANENQNLVVAADGRSGFRKARELRPSLILLDLALPVLNGVDVYKLLKADVTTKDIPVLIMTSMADGSGVMDSLIQNLRPRDCIHKPFGAEEFAARVSRLLAAPASATTEEGPTLQDLILRRGRIEVNLTRNKVLIEGQPKKIWPSLFAVLRVMISHPEAVSVERIIADVGEEDHSPEAIRKAVERLREVLNLPGDPIVAIGHGYKLVG